MYNRCTTAHEILELKYEQACPFFRVDAVKQTVQIQKNPEKATKIHEKVDVKGERGDMLQSDLKRMKKRAAAISPWLPSGIPDEPECRVLPQCRRTAYLEVATNKI